jgi:hypothetical protein
VSERRVFETLRTRIFQQSFNLTHIPPILEDIYHEGRILADGIVPRELIYSCRHFRREMRGLSVPRGIYVRVCGTSDDQSSSAEGASHACVEGFLPGLGWTGFDPTNDTVCGDRHIRVAIGRDYAEVPPTRGVYKGGGESELSVAVTVGLSDAPTSEDLVPITVERVPTSFQWVPTLHTLIATSDGVHARFSTFSLAPFWDPDLCSWTVTSSRSSLASQVQ